MLRKLGDEPRWAGLRFRRELPLWLTEISAVPAYNPKCEENQLPLLWDAPALAASASDAPTSMPMAVLLMAATPDAGELDGAGLRLAGFQQATLDLADVAWAVFLEACGLHHLGHFHA